MKGDKTMDAIISLIVFFLSSIAITGSSFWDNQIWNGVFYVAGLAAYAIVGILMAAGLIEGKGMGRDAYKIALFVLLLAGIGVYKGLSFVRAWMLSWELWVKILVVTLISAIGIAAVTLAVFRDIKKNKRENDTAKTNDR